MMDKKSENYRKFISIRSYGISFLIFSIIFLWGSLGLESGNEMGYVLMNFYIIMPIISFITGSVLGFRDAYLKWAYPIIFGILGVLIPTIIFELVFDPISIFFSFIPASLGLVIGITINKFKNRK